MTIDLELRNRIRRLYFVEHFTINAISEALDVHHETVKRAISYEKFKKKREQGTKELERYHDLIEEKLKIYPKLRATRILEMLRDRGYEGSIESVRRYVKPLRNTVREAFLVRAPYPGEEGQVDWGHFGSIRVGKAKRKLYLFVMVLSYSRYLYARFTLDMKTATFLRCHTEAFKFFNGVPRTLLYDNLKSVVLERRGEAIRFNEETLDFAGHYNFDPKPCHPYRGNEKGRVERSIGYVRTSFFEGREFHDLDDVNEKIAKWRDKTANKRPWPDNSAFSVDQKFKEENLLPLPAAHVVPEETLVVRARKTAFIKFDLNWYSIPPDLVRLPLTLRASEKKVTVYHKLKAVAEHPRSWSREERIEDLLHRNQLLQRKKAGVTASDKEALIRETPEVASLLSLLAERGESIYRAIRLFKNYRREYGSDAFSDSVKEALQRGTPRPESILYLLRKSEAKAKTKPHIPVILPQKAEVRDLSIRSHDLDIYDEL